MNQNKTNEDCIYLMKDQTCGLGKGYGPCKDCKIFPHIKIQYDYADILHEEMKKLERTTIKKMAWIGRIVRKSIKKWQEDADALELRIKNLEEGKK